MTHEICHVLCYSYHAANGSMGVTGVFSDGAVALPKQPQPFPVLAARSHLRSALSLVMAWLFG